MRQEALENEIKREKEQHAFDEKKSSAAQLEELKTAKRRAKRQKLKVRPRARGAAPPHTAQAAAAQLTHPTRDPTALAGEAQEGEARQGRARADGG